MSGVGTFWGNVKYLNTVHIPKVELNFNRVA